MTVNTGFGDAYSAAQWVEYCNANSKTVGGSWRVKNGNTKPYDVKYWCVGNEMYGNWQLGYMSLNHYAAKHNQVAKAMLKVDPKVVLIGSGDLGNGGQTFDSATPPPRGWSQGMLEMAGQNMHLISEHFYGGRVPWNTVGRQPLMKTIVEMRNSIRGKAEGHRALQKRIRQLNGRVIPIAMDEWNYWHRDYVFGELGCSYDLADGLGIAVGLHEYFRQTDIITIATYAQTVNVIGAIKTSRTAAEMESTGLAMMLYKRHFGNLPIEVQGTFGDLDVVAALSADRKSVTIGVVNPTDQPVTMDFNMPGLLMDKAKTHYMTGDSPTALNLPGMRRQVDIFEAKGTTVPQLSCAVIVIPLG
ncbi:MAG TPA: alpha-L-arabinofuranosidase C-terminal domain-containing protein [Fimbriimonas sp.]|nr:alpha-L-arabinofuranosidase C-terminal domain-containing protein [Fimbriimonas sp.]